MCLDNSPVSATYIAFLCFISTRSSTGRNLVEYVRAPPSQVAIAPNDSSCMGALMHTICAFVSPLRAAYAIFVNRSSMTPPRRSSHTM